MFKSFTITALLCFFMLLSGVAIAAGEPTALITGANRGIGLEFVKQLQAQGYNVIGTARKPQKAADLKKTGAKVLQLDVTDSASVSSLADALKGQPIDLLINNAGVSGHDAPTFKDTDFDKIAFTFDVNSLGPMRVTQALLDNVLMSKQKRVVHISSIMGSIEKNWGGSYGYRASKTALNMFNSSLAIEIGKQGVTSVVLHPGWVKTDMGGASAQVETVDSVAGMVKVISGLTLADSGRFVDFQGVELPW
ncbi:MAG: SDR family oxidoreductase [Halioglobus sp.]